jgi:hypothetical protein
MPGDENRIGRWRRSRGSECYNAQWRGWLAIMRKYVEQHGAFPSESGTWTSPSGEIYKIGSWGHRQRRKDRAGTLKKERAKMLDEVFPGWKEEPKAAERAERWENWLEALAEYYAAKGLPLARSGWKRADDTTWDVGTWLRAQRKAHERGKLSADRVGMLDVTVPDWKGAAA